MISVPFQCKPFCITVIQVYALTKNAKEAEAEWFYKDIKDLLELTHTKNVLFIMEVGGTIKDRISKDLTKAEAIKKRWQEYTKLYQKSLNDPYNQDGVITHLNPDILECELKRALGSITMNKASGGGGIPAELLKP